MPTLQKQGRSPKNEAAELPVRLVTKEELAEYLGISPRTVEDWVRLRQIPLYKPSRNIVRFDLREVLELVKIPVGGRR